MPAYCGWLLADSKIDVFVFAMMPFSSNSAWESPFSWDREWRSVLAIACRISEVIRATAMPLATSPAQPVTLEVWNGAIAGAGLPTFDAAKRGVMFGGKGITALILATGHNNGGQPGTEFTAQTSTFIKAMQAENPGLAVVVVSQNPQFPPSSMIARHRERQAALRVWAKDNRVDYVGGYEAFAAQPDGGVSLVLADGIHPTTPPSGLTGAYGSVLWADAFNAATS